MELCRPSDSHLEHVDFECLFSCLSLRLLLRVFGSLLLERRVIFTADKLRSVPVYPTNLKYHQMSVQLNSDIRCKTTGRSLHGVCIKMEVYSGNSAKRDGRRRGQGKSQSSGTVFGLE